MASLHCFRGHSVSWFSRSVGDARGLGETAGSITGRVMDSTATPPGAPPSRSIRELPPGTTEGAHGFAFRRGLQHDLVRGLRRHK
jgi:hypothetical protein